eukprot:224457-Chlamydomonas_euryale.AAC.1
MHSNGVATAFEKLPQAVPPSPAPYPTPPIAPFPSSAGRGAHMRFHVGVRVVGWVFGRVGVCVGGWMAAWVGGRHTAYGVAYDLWSGLRPMEWPTTCGVQIC